jgi:TonB family protein
MSVAISLGLVMSVLIALDQLVEVPELAREELESVPTRVARFVLEEQVVARPAAPRPEDLVEEPELLELEPEKPEVVEPEVLVPPPPTSRVESRAEASAEEIERAREKAATSGVLAMSDQLAALRNLSKVDNLIGRQLKSAGIGRSGRSDEDLVARRARRGSGGIETSTVAMRESEKLAGRSTTRVDLPEELVEEKRRAAAALDRQRTTEEIQLVFDQHKAAFYALYRRALRRRTGLQGRVVFELEIAPSGRVTSCRILSSGLDDDELERKLISRIQMIEFGAKDVEVWKSSYHIDFAPSG